MTTVATREALVPVVFVVEDDDDLRETTCQILEQEGFEVETASDGSMALARLRQGFRPALLLVDYRMPGVDGASVLREMRGSPDLAIIPTVLMTAAGTSAPTDLACPLLRKPFELDELLVLVGSYVPRVDARSGTTHRIVRERS